MSQLSATAPRQQNPARYAESAATTCPSVPQQCHRQPRSVLMSERNEAPRVRLASLSAAAIWLVLIGQVGCASRRPPRRPLTPIISVRSLTVETTRSREVHARPSASSRRPVPKEIVEQILENIDEEIQLSQDGKSSAALEDIRRRRRDLYRKAPRTDEKNTQ